MPQGYYHTIARVLCEKNNTEYDISISVFTQYPLTNNCVRDEMATKILNEHKAEGAKKVEFKKSDFFNI